MGGVEIMLDGCCRYSARIFGRYLSKWNAKNRRYETRYFRTRNAVERATQVEMDTLKTFGTLGES